MSLDTVHLDWATPQVMAIVNLTPDSFFDGGRYTQATAIHDRIDKVVAEGAAIVDLGAYSTRPGAAQVTLEEEWKRLVPALTYMRKNYEKIPISIDTFRAEIADRVRRYFGKFILNDISGGTLDDALLPWVGKHKMPYVLMHIQGTPQTMQQQPTYKNVVAEVYDFLAQKLAKLRELGAEDIIIDLGFGFGKTVQHNYTLLKNMESFQKLGHPMLAGVSRKSMIYKVLENNAEEALNGTTVLHTVALQKGARILRVHDVKEAKEAIKLVATLQNA